MKKLLLIVFLLFGFLLARGQQDAQYTNFLLNNYMINPAIAGIKECLDVRLGYRTQWVGFEGNPKTAFVTANGRIKSLTKSADRGPWYGAGAYVESDNTGPSSRTFIGASFAMHFKLTRKTKMAFGISAGIFQYRLDESKIRLAQPNDPAINSSVSSLLYPDISPGVWLYSKKWFAGLSYKHAIPIKITDVGTDSYYNPTFNLMGGLQLGDPDKVSYIPAMLIKATRNSPIAADVNFWVDFKNVLSLGAAYRYQDAVAGMLKLNFLKYFTLSYAYDYTLSKISYGSSNTHEIMIGFIACPRSQRQGFVPCAAYD